MRVIPITANLYKFNKPYTALPVISGEGQFDAISFSSAWWRKNKYTELNSDTIELSRQIESEQSEVTEASKVEEAEDVVKEAESPEIELSANDLILSYRLADVLHRLDDKTIICLASKDVPLKSAVQRQLTSEDSFLSNPKNIENVYIIDLHGISSMFAYLMIAKNGDNIITYGQAKNLTSCDKGYYQMKNIVQQNDVLELECNAKLKFLETKKEANIPMYDAKYPAESFLSKDNKLTGGVVLNNNWNPNESVEVFEKLGEVIQQRICNRSEDLPETQNIPHRTFKDVAGLDETIAQVKKQILYPMLYPKAFPNVTNCGTIFYGPPGTGKTLLAQAIIGEAKERKDKTINFINIDGQSLESKWVGATEAAWRNVFKEAVEKQPCILFIDEIDAVLRERSDDSSARYQNKTVSQFLTLISDIEKNNHKIWIIGATNRPELIDSAIKRSGRIGNMIEVKKPDEKGCLAILNHYLKDKNVSKDFDRVKFANEIYNLGYTGADIANLVNMARDKMYERSGVYEQMENNTFVDRELNDLEYIDEDFEKSLT